MKTFITSIGLAFLFIAGLQAQQYQATTIVSLQYTNAPADITNVNAVVTATKWDSFALEVLAGLTNASTAGLDLQWTTSCDGVNYYPSPVGAGASGWFRVPLTNAGAASCWSTNITIGDIGYWRINYVTNASAQHMTNLTIKVWRKPKTSG